MTTLNAIAPMRLAMAAAKAFVLALSRALAKELEGSGVKVRCVLPGATATAFWRMPGASIETPPTSWVMTPDNLVDAALVGLDRGEFATMPSLADPEQCAAWERARGPMLPHLSSSSIAPCCRLAAAAGA